MEAVIFVGLILIAYLGYKVLSLAKELGEYEL